jgi:ABC-type nitrate/sulfonate/bicarbonate transport system permease component
MHTEPQPPARDARSSESWFARQSREFLAIRKPAPRWQVLPLALLCIALVLGLWWFVTRGEGADQRILRPGVLPSPAETFGSFKSLWYDRALTRNTLASLRRVAWGFALAALLGVPLGVLAGCFSRVQAFLLPLTIFGRNIPIAALIPLTFSLFGVGELQKVMFICIACIAFVLSDTADAVRDVGTRYIDTAYTLGANRRQVILKVLVPLAMPSIFNSLRLLFGLAFGYIMLAELVKFSNESGGLGDIILTSQRRGNREHILLVLMIIPVVALAIDRAIYWVQRELFPHQYGGSGILNRAVRWLMHRWEDLKSLFFRSAAPVGAGTQIESGASRQP